MDTEIALLIYCFTLGFVTIYVFLIKITLPDIFAECVCSYYGLRVWS